MDAGTATGSDPTQIDDMFELDVVELPSPSTYGCVMTPEKPYWHVPDERVGSG